MFPPQAPLHRAAHRKGWGRGKEDRERRKKKRKRLRLNEKARVPRKPRSYNLISKVTYYGFYCILMATLTKPDTV